MRAIGVGDEIEGDIGRHIGPERLDGQGRAEIRAADADIDHALEAFARGAKTSTISDALREGIGALSFRLDRRHDGFAADGKVHPIAPRRCARWRGLGTQRHVQGGAMLGGIHRFAGEQAAAVFLDPRLARQFHQGIEGRPVDAVLGKIEQ
jgi:hypothetical protein